MKRTLTAALAIAAMCFVLGSARPANAYYAKGYHRAVNIWVVSFWLHHTFSYYSHGDQWECFGGSCSGYTYSHYTSNIWDGEYTCMQNASHLTYGVTGVCHQATNRGLAHTAIPYVIDWGGVGGAGTSRALYCTYGCGLWCYGAPC